LILQLAQPLFMAQVAIRRWANQSRWRASEVIDSASDAGLSYKLACGS
jgi:hypothetical protein